MKTIVLSSFEYGENIQYKYGEINKYIDHIPDEISGAFRVILEYMESYKTPQERLKDEIITSFVSNATTDELIENKDLFDEWKEDHEYKTGEHFQANGRLYQALKDHISKMPPGAKAEGLYKQLRRSDEAIEPWQDDHTYLFRDRYMDAEGIVQESLYDKNEFDAIAFPAGWRRLGTLEEYRAREEMLSGESGS